MENVFKAAVVVFVAAAAAFFFIGNIDGVFVSIVFACLSFFLIVRFQVKGRLAEREKELLAEAGAGRDLTNLEPEEHERTEQES
ncbi:MAG: hypothetical protein IPM63_07120 [Acidobacteriota bacterium]|nr:MAG: hypothetical protein IPM63_07120 [Acidobacteriota bacterium]